MQIKTPVNFVVDGSNIDLVDATGRALIYCETPCTPDPETRQAIVWAFEDAARWQFLMLAIANVDGPEGALMAKLGDEMPADAEHKPAKYLIALVDAARAAPAK